jgi:heptaprenyl diphosphate synthase
MRKRTAELGFYLAIALILSYVESLIPLSIGIPGIKLGLPNAVVVLLLHEKGTIKEAALVNALRIILSGFLFGSLYSILYALAGAVCSFIAMLVVRKLRCFTVIGVSVTGGVFHNIGQIAVAAFVVESTAVVYYLPFLMIAGTLTGAILGVVVMELVPYLQRSIFS